MIRMITLNGDFVPVLSCDHCQRRIVSSADGWIYWTQTLGLGDCIGEGGKTYHLHDECAGLFILAKGDAYKLAWIRRPISWILKSVVNGLRLVEGVPE